MPSINAIAIAIQTDIVSNVYAVNRYINNFKSRVLADGGTFEAQTCLQRTLASLLIEFGEVEEIVYNFKSRVLADGGSFEAEPCLLTTLNELDV